MLQQNNIPFSAYNMKERIALTELNADLATITAEMHKFAADRKSTAESVRDKHAAGLRSLNGVHTQYTRLPFHCPLYSAQ